VPLGYPLLQTGEHLGNLYISHARCWARLGLGSKKD